MKCLAFAFGLASLAGLAWLFVIVTVPFARKVGLLKKKEDKNEKDSNYRSNSTHINRL